MLLTCSCFPFLSGTTTLAILQFPLQNWTTSIFGTVAGENVQSKEHKRNRLANVEFFELSKLAPFFLIFHMQNRYRDVYGRFAKRSNMDSEALFVNLFDSTSSSSSLSTYSHTSNTMNEDEFLIKSLHDYLHPTRNSAPSCIMFPTNVQNLDFKPGMIPLLPTFNGMENEKPYVYIREFEEVLAIFHNKLGAMDILD